MTTATDAPTTTVELSVDEQWAAHAALVDAVEAAFEARGADAAPVVALALVEKLEAGRREFTAAECAHLERELAALASDDGAPARDREAARSAVAKLRRCPPTTA